MTRVLIIGAGISGLATAWFLRARGIPAVVLERASEAGGNVRTFERDGFLVDTGPTSTLYRGAAFERLVTGLGLATEIVQPDRGAARYIVKDGALARLPSGPFEFVTTPVFSASAKARLLMEPFFSKAQEEESLAQFTRRRLGVEFLDWAIDPFVSGVYAGDPERLSVRAAVPRVYVLEAQYSSLLVGAFAKAFRGLSGGPPGRLISFKRGMQSLPRALTRALGADVHCNADVSTVTRVADEWVARTAAGAEYRASHLVLAVPAFQAAQLLATLAPHAATALNEIRYAPVASLALGYRSDQFPRPPDGFGVLFPRRAQRQTLGIIFSSSLFPQRAPAQHVLLTAFVGGMRNPGAVEQGTAGLIDTVNADVRAVLGVQGEPVFHQSSVYHRAIPQYELGHLERVMRAEGALRPLPRLYVRGNWRDGVSFADCVNNAAAFADTLNPL